MTAIADTPAQPATSAARVTTLELFFDLVFVFTVTQLTEVLVEDLSWRSLGRVVLMLAIIWWMYAGYAWLTNNVDPRSMRRRVVLLGGMAGYLVVALAIPDAFTGTGLTFGLGYLVVICVHGSLFLLSASEFSSRAFRPVAAMNGVMAALVVAGGAVGGTAQVVLWILAALVWIAPLAVTEIEVAAGHFVERHGLVVLIAIGESVVAIGIGAAGLPVDAELVFVAVLGLLLSTALWWTYFGADDDEQAERALDAAPPRERPRMALDGFGRAHGFLLLGIVLVAAGIKKATGHAYDELTTAQTLTLGGGAALFLLSDVWFRATLGLGRSGWRTAAAAAALATVPLGAHVAAVAQLAALVLLLGTALTAEARGAPT